MEIREEKTFDNFDDGRRAFLEAFAGNFPIKDDSHFIS